MSCLSTVETKSEEVSTQTPEPSSHMAEASGHTPEVSSQTAEANSASSQLFTPSDTSFYQDTVQHETNEGEAMVSPPLNHAPDDKTSEMVPPKSKGDDTNFEVDQVRSNDSHKNSKTTHTCTCTCTSGKDSDNPPVKTHNSSGTPLESRDIDVGYNTASATATCTSEHENSHEQSSSASSSQLESTLEDNVSTHAHSAEHTPEEAQHTPEEQPIEASGGSEICHPTAQTASSTVVLRRTGPTLEEFGTNIHVVDSSRNEEHVRRARIQPRGVEDIDRGKPGSSTSYNWREKQTEREEGKKFTLISIDCSNACVCTCKCFNTSLTTAICVFIVYAILLMVQICLAILLYLYMFVNTYTCI